MTTSLTCGCQCGAIRYRVDGAPNNVTNCHCRMCQKAHGAGVVTWAEFPSVNLSWDETEPTWYRSSDIAERGFCPACGTPLTFRRVGGDATDIALATLDEADALMPEDELWTESQRAWVPVNENLPRHPRGRT